MSDRQIETKVIEIIAAQLDVEKSFVLPETNLQTDLSASSLDYVEIMIEMEKAFSIFISDEEAAKTKTVNDIIALVKSKLDKEV
jgi:acyl carrier protein